MSGTPRPSATARLRRLVHASPELVTALLAALVFAAILEWRYLADRAEFQRAASAIDNASQARLHVTRAYLIVRSIEAGDRSFSPPDADASLDRALLALDDWNQGRTVSTWSSGGKLRDPEIRRLTGAYAQDIARFRALLRAPPSPATRVSLRGAFSQLEARGDSIGNRAALLLQERERQDRRQHEATIFLLAFLVIVAGGWLRRTAEAARRVAGRERRLQALTARLAGARTPADVAGAVARHGIAASGATLGSVGLVTPDRREVAIVAKSGTPQGWDRFSIDDQLPAAEAVRTRRPVFIEDEATLYARYPALRRPGADHLCAIAVVPLLQAASGDAGEPPDPLGYASFTFDHPHRFPRDERRFLETIGELSSQAMDRAVTSAAERDARDAASRERERLRLILEQLPIGVAVVDGRGEVTLYNRMLEELLGQPVPAGTGFDEYTNYEFRRPDGRRYALEEYPVVRALQHGEVVAGEVLLAQSPKGGSIPLAISAAPGPPDANGRPTFAVATFLDISPLHMAQRALQESEARLRDMAERVPVGIFTADGAGDITWCNPRLAELLGTTPEDVRGRGVVSFVIPEDAESAAENRRRFRGGPVESQRFEYRVRHASSGRIRQVVLEVAARRDRHGVVQSTVGVVEDVTDQRALEAQLAQAQKMEAVGRLAGGIAHDFNNMLTAMLASTEILLEDAAPGDAHVGELRDIRDAVLRAAELTGQLLAFSRRQVIQPRAVDVNALARDSEKLLRRVIGEDVALELVLAPDAVLPLVYGDPGQLQQALLNLVVNARDAMPEGGAILVTTQHVRGREVIGADDPATLAASYVDLTVSDTGCGMDASVQAHIFEPFFTTKPTGQGTGLGLAMVYGAITQVGGQVAVESEPGKGTCFHLYLPLAPEGASMTATRAETPRPAIPRGDGATVLVVEDDPALRRAMRRMLERGGFHVLDAEGAEEAVRIARSHEGAIDVVLTDVIMRGTGGREAAEAIARVRPEAAIGFMSGYTADVVLRQRVESGASFLQKPFSPEELVGFVREVLRGGNRE